MNEMKTETFFIIGYRFVKGGYSHIRYNLNEEAKFNQTLEQIQSLFGKKAKVQVGDISDAERGLAILDMSSIVAVEARRVTQPVYPTDLLAGAVNYPVPADGQAQAQAKAEEPDASGGYNP